MLLVGTVLVRHTKQMMDYDEVYNRIRLILYSLISPNNFVPAAFSPIVAERLKTLPHIPFMCPKYGMCKGSSAMMALFACAACGLMDISYIKNLFLGPSEPNMPPFAVLLFFRFT